jgi:tRNA A-37 threonylcarbamoyl transferase component Bud32/TolB-like protein/tetratricopeptide (TPR) repeat protein
MVKTLERLKRALAERYTIERELGRGGMATVYLARDLKHERRVALKVLHPELARVLGPERFLREIKVTAQLHHPHILPLYDSGETHGLLFYVMPYVEGESLRNRLTREKQLPLEEALRIAREVADALSYAHSHDVIHRDIKPENILLESGHAVVADFGIARAISVAGGTRLTETGLALGTPAYMSPEQAAGERELDGRTDLYSLGCVLYEMLAGTPPITGPSMAVVLARKSVEVPPPLRRARSAVPPAVEEAVTRALSVVPADRQRTASELAEQLGSPRVVAAAGEPRPMPVARRRLVPALVAVSVLVAVGVAALWWVLAGGGAGAGAAGAANRVVVLPYENQTGDSTLEPIGRMVAEWVTEGLARTNEVQVVPNLVVVQTLAGIKPGSGRVGAEAPIQELARLTQAGLAVSGSYYRNGAALELHSEVLDVKSGRTLGVVEPVLGRADDPTAAIDTVRLRVMGVLAARLGRVRWEIPASVQPPTYEAYRAYAEGMKRWTAGEYAEAGAEFERAYALDSTYLRALIFASSAYGSSGNPARSDSLTEFLVLRRDRLSPYDQYRLDFGLATLRGDREAQLQAARAAVALVPNGTARFALIVSLEAVNRPREALRELEDVVGQGMPEGGTSWYAIWGLQTELYHVLDKHERELAVARDGRARLGGSLPLMEYEGRALAALGRMDELRGLQGEILAQHVRGGVAPGDALLAIGMELRAHGRAAEAAEVADRALAWYGAQPAALIARGWRKDLRASLLYLRERWPDAAAQWDSIPVDSAAPVDRLGTRGVLAARLGQADSARAIAGTLARLDRPRMNGQHTLWRARIAAVLGQKDSAVTLLRQALAEGVGYGSWLHADMDLEALRDYRPYRELVRPKG